MVILVDLPIAHILLAVLAAVPDAGVGHLHAHLLLEEALECVGGVDPAVSVEHVLGNVLGVDAVDGVAHVLARRHDQAERDQQDHRYRVMQPEHRRVDLNIVYFYEIL